MLGKSGGLSPRCGWQRLMSIARGEIWGAMEHHRLQPPLRVREGFAEDGLEITRRSESTEKGKGDLVGSCPSSGGSLLTGDKARAGPGSWRYSWRGTHPRANLGVSC